jgi:hypothetical protein
MALLTRQALRDRASRQTFAKSATSLLAESVRNAAKAQKAFDVFLSHSYADAAAILGLKITLEGHGMSVYVDWVEDTQFERTKVDQATATQLRNRMRSCKSLLYAVSPNSANSKWMPWELGYFDGFNGKVALVPIVETPAAEFQGQEYLSLYPYVDEAASSKDQRPRLWINSSATEYQQMSVWLQAA